MPASNEARYRVYTDGGADPNPGAGGWGVVILEPAGEERELSGGEAWATNNRMELTAAIRGLEALPRGAPAALYTDSIYLKKGVTEWLRGWIARGWRRRTGELQNEDLWRRLAALLEERDVTWHWVRGHAGHRHNERADRLATREVQARKGARQEAESPGVEAEVFLRVSGGGGAGGWAAAVRHGGGERIESGSSPGASANELDVLAAAEVLEGLPEGITVAVHSASDYLRNGATRWLPAWRRRGWTTKAGTPVRNRRAWERLAAALARRQVVWQPVGDPRPEGWKALGKRAREAAK